MADAPDTVAQHDVPDVEPEVPVWSPLPPALRCVPLLDPLCVAFGLKPVAAISMVYFVVRGILMQLIGAVQLPIFKDVIGTASASVYQRYAAVPVLAWAVKPAVGVASDALPLMGYHKRTYMGAAGVLIVVLALATAAVPRHAAWGPAFAAAGFFGMNLGCAALDLLTESKYAQLMASRPDTGSMLVSWVWALAMVGGIVGALVEGPLADGSASRWALVACAPLGLLAALPSLLNWYAEAPAGGYARAASHSDGDVAASGVFGRVLARMDPVAQQHPRVVGYGIAVSAGAAIVALVSVLGTLPVHFGVTAVVVAGLAAASGSCLPAIVARANIFMLLKEMLYVQIPGALDFFFTADDKCLPGGPNFSYTYYQTFTGVVGYVAGAAGVAVFQRSLSKRRYCTVLWITTGVKIVSSFFDVVLAARWNKQWGVSDHATYLLGDAIVFNACQMLDFMPIVVLISRLCPHGLEAVMYALLAGFSNFGQNVSRSIGLVLIDAFGIKTELPCDFSRLPQLVFVAHCVLPLAVFPLAWVLLPEATLDAKLNDAVEGLAGGASGDGDSQSDGDNEELVPIV